MVLEVKSVTGYVADQERLHQEIIALDDQTFADFAAFSAKLDEIGVSTLARDENLSSRGNKLVFNLQYQGVQYLLSFAAA